MADPRVYILDGGTLVIDHSDIFWHVDPGTPVRFPAYSVLVEHSDALIMFDSSFDLELTNAVLPFELPEQTPEQTVPAQLGLCGYTPADVDIVINSHLHFDHVGGNKHLTNAVMLAHTDEVRHAHVPEAFERLGYSDPSFAEGAGTYRPISGDYEVVPGVHLFETPGHTVGHYSMLVQMQNEHSMLFAGDAAYTHRSLTDEIIGGFHLDPTDSLHSIRRINYLSRTQDATVYPGHDMEAFRTWKLAPNYYGGS